MRISTIILVLASVFSVLVFGMGWGYQIGYHDGVVAYVYKTNDMRYITKNAKRIRPQTHTRRK